jgi:hypothetical protein
MAKKKASSMDIVKRSSKLPAALAKNAAAQAARKRARSADAARELLAHVREKQGEIADAFFEIGEALRQLEEPGMVEALGYSGFGELVERELRMNAATARELVRIATHVKRSNALAWGKERSIAMVELAAASGQNGDFIVPPRLRLGRGEGKLVDPTTWTAPEIDAAAQELRAAARGAKRAARGVHVTAAERARGKAIEQALRGAGCDRATVRAVARAGRGADLEVRNVPLTDTAKLARALRG